MPILETIAAANAAYSVIRTCIANGRESADLMKNVGKFLTAEDDIKRAVEKKKKSPLTAITGGEEGDWEEFQALENIRQKRKELESYIRLYGAPGQWDRWQQWQAESRKARQAARKEAERRREELMEKIAIGGGIFFAIIVIVGVLYVVGNRMGKW